MPSGSEMSSRLGTGGRVVVVVSLPSGEKGESRSLSIPLSVSSSASARSSLLLWLEEGGRRVEGEGEGERETHSQLVHLVWKFTALCQHIITKLNLPKAHTT